PPTARTFGEMAGYSGGDPVSPVDATNATPAWPVGVVKALSLLASLANSPLPQLIETATTFGWLAAYWTAVSKLEKVGLFPSTSKMLAPGATAWAHSTSRDVSSDQLLSGAVRVEPPLWLTLLKTGSGKPKATSKRWRSDAMVGASNAST